MSSAEDAFKKIVWHSVLESSDSLEKFITWSIGGTAVLTGLLITNLESLSHIAALSALKLSLLLLATSIVAGAVSKQYGMMVSTGLKTARRMASLLESDSGRMLMDQMKISPARLADEISEPFIWPLSRFIKRGGRRGISDPLAPEKRFIRSFSLQIAFTFLHGACAIAAILTIVFSVV